MKETTKMTNEDLIVKYRETNHKSYLDALYRSTEKFLYRMANKYHCDIDETYIGFMKAVNSYQCGRCKFVSWLGRVVGQQIIMSRRRKQLKVSSMDEVVDDIAKFTRHDLTPSPRADNTEIDKSALIEEIMSKLSAGKRELLDLYYMQGLTEQEIAVRFKQSRSYVHKRRQAILAELKGVYL